MELVGDKKRIWFDYTCDNQARGFYSSSLDVRLSNGRGKITAAKFLCDTGSVLTWAGRREFLILFPDEEDNFKELLSETGIIDASGNPLLGVKKTITVTLSKDRPAILNEFSPENEITFVEDVYFGNVKLNMLGQTAFEKMGGLFLNFPNDKRRFALFEPA